jgi:hypothetical protein
LLGTVTFQNPAAVVSVSSISFFPVTGAGGPNVGKPTWARFLSSGGTFVADEDAGDVGSGKPIQVSYGSHAQIDIGSKIDVTVLTMGQSGAVNAIINALLANTTGAITLTSSQVRWSGFPLAAGITLPQATVYSVASFALPPGVTITVGPASSKTAAQLANAGVTLSTAGLFSASPTATVFDYSGIDLRCDDGQGHFADTGPWQLRVTAPVQVFQVNDTTFSRGFARSDTISVPSSITSGMVAPRIAIDSGYVGGLTTDPTLLKLNYDGSLGDPFCTNHQWDSGRAATDMPGDAVRPSFRLVAYDAQNLGQIVSQNLSGAVIGSSFTSPQAAINSLPSTGGKVLIPPGIVYSGNDLGTIGISFPPFAANAQITVESKIPGVRAILQGRITSGGGIGGVVGTNFPSGAASYVLTLNWLDISVKSRTSSSVGVTLAFGDWTLNMTGCRVHHCNNGLITGNQGGTVPKASVFLTDCQFGDCGSGDFSSGNTWGFYHPVYLGEMTKLAVVTGCYFYGSDGGHLAKFRGVENHLLGCVLRSEHSSYESAFENAAIDFDRAPDENLPGAQPHEIIGCLIEKVWPPTKHVHGPKPPSQPSYSTPGEIDLHGHMIQIGAQPMAGTGTPTTGKIRLHVYNNTIINPFDMTLQAEGGLFRSSFGVVGTPSGLPIDTVFDVKDNLYLGGPMSNTQSGIANNGVFKSNNAFLNDPTDNTVYTLAQLSAQFPLSSNSVPEYVPQNPVSCPARSIQRPKWGRSGAAYGSTAVTTTRRGAF